MIYRVIVRDDNKEVVNQLIEGNEDVKLLIDEIFNCFPFIDGSITIYPLENEMIIDEDNENRNN